MTIHCFGTRIGCDCDRIELVVRDSTGKVRQLGLKHSKNVLFNTLVDGESESDVYISRPLPFDVLQALFFRGDDLILDIHA